MQIKVKASELAKLIKYNTYADPAEVLKEFLAYNKITGDYIPKSNIEKKLLTLDKDKLLNIKKELKLKSTATLGDIESSIKKITNTSLTNKTEDGSKKELDKSLKSKPILTNILKVSIEQDTRMKRGNIRENKALDVTEKKLNINITDRNSQMYRTELLKTDKYEVILIGKVDGMSDGKIVETKNRRSRFFDKIPNYEKVQMECYMFLTDKKSCIHIENLDSKQNIREYSHDEDFWRKVLQKTKLYIDENLSPYL